jgi:hypothetical protein
MKRPFLENKDKMGDMRKSETAQRIISMILKVKAKTLLQSTATNSIFVIFPVNCRRTYPVSISGIKK